MVIYEVNLTIAPDQINEYSAWLEEHVRAMLQLDGFDSAALYARSGTNEGPGQNAGSSGDSDGDADAPERVPEGDRHWTLHYHLDSRESLDRYFEEEADAMRAKGTDRFGDQVSAERRVLESRQVFSHKER